MKSYHAKILQFSIKEPLLVRQKPDAKYEFIAGERHPKASIMVLIIEAPVLVFDMDDTTTHTFEVPFKFGSMYCRIK